MKISVCIPTYNRAAHLANCLQSIVSNKLGGSLDFQVCVSDNCSTDDTERIVRLAQQHMPIKFQKNSTNLGMTRNFLNVINMADGEFVWLIGDDDLLLPRAIEKLLYLVNRNQHIDYFYVNAYHLSTEYVSRFPQPFDVSNLPKEMVPFSPRLNSGELKFMELIDPGISFDFLGGIFLSVFRRRNWIANVGALSEVAISDTRIFSHFDNTFPHLKIFSRAFAHSAAYFHAEPLSVCLTGAREWAPLYPLVKSVRLVEALEQYRANGLPRVKYWRCRNSALDTFIPDLLKMFLNRDRSGFAYINPIRLILSNLLYPNVYLSVPHFLVGKARTIYESRRRSA